MPSTSIKSWYDNDVACIAMTELYQDETIRPTFIQWIVDTRPLWPVEKRTSPREEVAEFKNVASRALSFLPASEQASVLKYYHVKDAKMSLASQLLKHLVITKYCHVPWCKSAFSRDARGKPFWPPSDVASKNHVKIGFNVSHQAGLVSLIAVIGGDGDVEVGTDVVCVDERLDHDYRQIEKEGFFSWVDIYADVFAESEVSYMKLAPVGLSLDIGLDFNGFGRDMLSRCQQRNAMLEVQVVERGQQKATTLSLDSNVIIDAKMRRFYAMWCLREAYVKMTGEALLAPWLKELEILDVKAPEGDKTMHGPASLQKGQVVKDFRINFKGKPITNVMMELVALGTSYMVASSARSATGSDVSSLKMGDWKILDLESDILAFGEVFR